jgi:hypothetical protein
LKKRDIEELMEITNNKLTLNIRPKSGYQRPGVIQTIVVDPTELISSIKQQVKVITDFIVH